MPLSTTNLVKHYFNVCNTALSRHRHGMVYGALLELVNRLASGRTIAIEVAGAPATGPRRFTVRFVDGAFTPVRRGVHAPDVKRTLPRDFLEDVLAHADEYIEHPERLDWGWLRGH
ncbi:MAG: hypothetical protein KJ025_04245 [Burkholderiales bacterium]|nr:hypothetical protein [Burkholderiales bacterium]